MAQTTFCITIRWRWWAKPYLSALRAFIWSIAWAIDEDDERVAAFITRQAEFVVRHGLVTDLPRRASAPETYR